jgi:hypothetical protein
MSDWHIPLAVLAFGCVVLLFVLKAMTKGWVSASTRIVGLTLIITAALFLALVPQSVSALTPERFTAAFSLLSAAAGYLFAKE